MELTDIQKRLIKLDKKDAIFELDDGKIKLSNIEMPIAFEAEDAIIGGLENFFETAALNIPEYEIFFYCTKDKMNGVEISYNSTTDKLSLRLGGGWEDCYSTDYANEECRCNKYNSCKLIKMCNEIEE